MDPYSDGKAGRDLKELTVQELIQGYAHRVQEGMYTCIFCGEAFEDGTVYSSRARLVTAEKAADEHVCDAHGGAFLSLIALDKQLNGLSDVQKTLLTCLYERRETGDVAKEMGISAATVRAHRFHLQKAKREAKILLALLEQVEEDTYAPGLPEEPEAVPDQDALLALNSLHPFFTRIQYK